MRSTARSLADEIFVRPDGIVAGRARSVLAEAEEILREAAHCGLFKMIEKGTFGNISRSLEQGRGAEGIVPMADGYINPLMKLAKDPDR